jgi:hypothetical protein
VCFSVFGKCTLIIGYLLAFHFSGLFDPIKKFLNFKKNDKKLQKANYESMKPRDKETKFDGQTLANPPPKVGEIPSEPTRSTHYEHSYTGAFTSVPGTCTTYSASSLESKLLL